MLIVRLKRINGEIKLLIVADKETDGTRVLDFGIDEFATKPIRMETIVDKSIEY
jgi:DNA-binding response OmpR family regulator